MVLNIRERNPDEPDDLAGYEETEQVGEKAVAHNGNAPDWKNGTTQYYLNEMGKIPLMSHEEMIAHKRNMRPVEAEYIRVEKELEALRVDLRIKDWTEKRRAEAEKREKELVRELQKIQTPEFINALNAIVEGNLRFVVSKAKRFANIMPLEEAIQYGNLGLRKAAIRWDASKGFKFTTYAAWWIFESIAGGIAECMGSLRTSVNSGYLIIKIYDAMGRLEQKGIMEPTTEMIAKEINDFAKSEKSKKLRRRMHRRNEGKAPAEISVARVIQAQRADVAKNSVSLDYEYEDGGTLVEAVSLQVAEGKPPVEEERIEALMGIKRKEVSDNALRVLGEVDRKVVELRILQDKPDTIYEVGDRFGKSHQWTTNRINLALPAMRELLEGQGYTTDDLM